MLSNLRMIDAISIKNCMDLRTYQVSDTLFEGLQSDEQRHLLLESWRMDDFEALYFYDTDLDLGNGMLLEAITTTRARISQTMRAFIRALNQGLEGTGISAGVANVEDAADGTRVIGGAEIGKVRRSGNLALLPAQIPLSDGQTVTIVFHSPSGDTAKITAQDTLVAFRFFLNKRDVTHAVAPMSGREMSLKQTTQMLSNLIERNSAKFQKSRDKNAKLQAEIGEFEATSSQLDNQISALVDEGDTLNAQGTTLDTEYEKFRALADKQDKINDELQQQITKLQASKPTPLPEETITQPPAIEKPEITDKTRQVTENLNVTGEHKLSNGAVIKINVGDENNALTTWVSITTLEGVVYQISSPSPQTGATLDTAKKLLKLYRDGKADRYITPSTQGNEVDDQKPTSAPVPETTPAPEPVPEPQPEPELNDELRAALDDIARAAALQTMSIPEIKGHLKTMRAVYAVLEANGVLDQYIGTFDAASHHLGDLLDEIYRAGAF